MPKPPRVLVGTLMSGEGDFNKCCRAIERQHYPSFKHVVIEGLPETKAHYRLYQKFKKSKFDCLLKVDADMVLIDKYVIENMVKRLRDNHVWRVTYMVKDFFTRSEINGIHLYSRDVTWDWDKLAASKLFPDRCDDLQSRKARASFTRTFPRIGALHCFYANELQGFRYGFRRVLKNGFDECIKTVEHYVENPNSKSLRSAFLGIQMALSVSQEEAESILKGLGSAIPNISSEENPQNVLDELINRRDTV